MLIQHSYNIHRGARTEECSSVQLVYECLNVSSIYKLKEGIRGDVEINFKHMAAIMAMSASILTKVPTHFLDFNKNFTPKNNNRARNNNPYLSQRHHSLPMTKISMQN